MPAVAREIGDVEAVITRDAGLTTAAIDAAPGLLVIANHGIGTNKIDVARAAELGVPIVFTPTANSRSVAEQTIALMLAVAKRTVAADSATRRGDWPFRYSGGLMEISGKTLGLIGFGSIAREVCRMAGTGFGMRVLVWSPRAEDGAITAAGAERVAELEALLTAADVVSMHRPLRPDTRHTLDAGRLRLLKPKAIVVNTARGGLIDEDALAAVLREERIAGAGLDVFASEPLPSASPLACLPNVVLGPHIAGATDDALQRTAEQCADQIIDVLCGREPRHLLDPEVWSRRRRPPEVRP
jgi:D-3-phosphoglycerate dehydrogenase